MLDGDGVALATLFSEAKPVGAQSFRWLPDALPDGSYTRADQREDASTAARSPRACRSRSTERLSFVSSKPAFISPNGDGRSDSLHVAFTLAVDADVTVTVRRGPSVTATLLAGRFGPGAQSVDWNGTIAGVPVPDGTYETMVEATTSLGVASQATKLVVDSTAPVLRLVSAFKRLATLSRAGDGDRPSWTAACGCSSDGKPVCSAFLRRARTAPPALLARDRAGNVARQLSVRRQKPKRRTPARAAAAARPAARRG